MVKMSKNILIAFMIFAIMFTCVPFGLALDDLTVQSEIEGTQVNIFGGTTAETEVSLLIIRSDDREKVYIDNMSSDEDGNYRFSFKMDSGEYSAILTSNGIQKEENLFVTDSNTVYVSVRIEGETETLLPERQVMINDGQSTLIKTIEKAMNLESIDYEIDGMMIETVKGEEGWQYLVNNRGGMTLPTAKLHAGDEIVLIDDKIIDPVITRLSTEKSEYKSGEKIKVEFEAIESSNFLPIANKLVRMGTQQGITDAKGEVTLTAAYAGDHKLSVEPGENYIRPVPLMIKVTGDSSSEDDPQEAESVGVYIRIEGYDHTILPRQYVDVDLFDLDPYLGEASGSSGTESKGWGVDKFARPSNAHAILKVLKNAGISYDFQDYGWSLYIAMIDGEREKDHKGMSGWMYRVNGVMPNVGCNARPLSEDDEIVWYYGAYGFDNIYTELEAEKTLIKPEEEVKIHVNGWTKGFENKHESIEGVTVLANGKPLMIDGEKVVTDENGNAILKFKDAGSYEISLIRNKKDTVPESGTDYIDIVRPVTVNITVKGASAGGGGGVLNDEYSGDYDTVTDPKATEKDIAEATQNVTEKLENKVKEVNDESSAKEVVKDIKDVNKIIEKAAEKVENQEAVEKVLNQGINVVESLSKAAEKLSKVTDKEDAAELAVANMEVSTKLIEKMEDKKAMNQATGKVIEAAGNLISKLGQDVAKELIDATLEVADKAIESASTEKISKTAVKVTGERAVAEINSAKVTKAIAGIKSTIASIKGKLAASGLHPVKAMENKLTIDMGGIKEKEVEAKVSREIVSALKANATAEMEIKTAKAIFKITPNTFDPSKVDEGFSVSSKLINGNDLPFDMLRDVPKGSQIFDFKAKVGEEEVTDFNSAMEISIPYSGKVEVGETVKAYYLADSGKIESMGGKYDAKTKQVTFKASHFSKYFAKKVAAGAGDGMFKDLAGYEWARKAIETMGSKGIISGRGAGIFDPGADITRAEFAGLMTKMLGMEANSEELKFTDVPKDAWYYVAVQKAYQNGLISGRSEAIFDPEGKITRQEMAAIISKVLISKGYVSNGTMSLEAFVDKGEISDWAKEAANICAQEGIISGMGENRFAPLERSNRAQAAGMLYNLYNLIMK